MTIKFVTKIKIYFHLSFEKYFKICQLGIVVRLFGLLSLEPGSRMSNKREHGEKLRREHQARAVLSTKGCAAGSYELKSDLVWRRKGELVRLTRTERQRFFKFTF